MTGPRGSHSGGFTLIELLIVIGIVGFLAGAILVAVDPVKRVQDARDGRRSAEVYSILNAILTKQTDDRATYNGCCSAGGAEIQTQAGGDVQVLVTDATGIVCNDAATRPGCGFPMDTSGANTNCVANIGYFFTGTGTATSTGSSAFVNGSGTSFTTQTAPGNTVRSASGGTCTVLSVNSNVQISCTTTPSPVFSGGMENHIAGTGTATSSNTTSFVNGSGTSFTTEVQVGDTLTSASTGVCSVQIINSNTQITCSNTPSPVFSGSLSWTRNATGSITSSGTAITGVGTTFTTQVVAGDVISQGASSCTVQSVTDDTNLTCTAPPSPGAFLGGGYSVTRGLSGTATSTPNTPMVFGAGTSFLTEQAIATRIRSSSGGNCIIVTRVSNTQITCTASLSPAFSGGFTWGRVMSGTGTSTVTTGTVNGTGTAFTTEISPTDTLTSASGGTCVVTTVNSASQLSCASAPSPVFSGTYIVSTTNGESLAPKYISSLPTDPAGGTPCASGSGCAVEGDLAIGASNSGYYIRRTAGGRVEIGACKAEQAGVIKVKR